MCCLFNSVSLFMSGSMAPLRPILVASARFAGRRQAAHPAVRQARGHQLDDACEAGQLGPAEQVAGGAAARQAGAAAPGYQAGAVRGPLGRCDIKEPKHNLRHGGSCSCGQGAGDRVMSLLQLVVLRLQRVLPAGEVHLRLLRPPAAKVAASGQGPPEPSQMPAPAAAAASAPATVAAAAPPPTAPVPASASDGAPQVCCRAHCTHTQEGRQHWVVCDSQRCS